MPTLVYTIGGRDQGWGDYGDILIHGMTRHLGRSKGLLQLERTALFIPPVTLPGIHDVIVTATAKEFLEQAVDGLQFQPVTKARIVRLDWHQWDRLLEDPPVFPEDGEPESYILERSHDPDMAADLGELWELVPDIIPSCQLPGGTFGASQYSGQENLPRFNVEHAWSTLMWRIFPS